MGVPISLDSYLAGQRQRVRLLKTVTRTVVATIPFSLFDIAGTLGAGTIAGTSTTAGVIPTDSTPGCPTLDFTGPAGLSKVEFGSSTPCRLSIFDMIWKAGAYSYVAGTTALSAQPVISGRCPDYLGGASFGDRNEIWIEVSTAFVTGTAWQVGVTYTNSDGVTGRTAIIFAAQAAAALTLGKMFMLALQSGDTGVQKIDSVIITNGGTAMTAGAFNVLILRPLWTMGRVRTSNDGDIHDMLKTGMPIVYDTSAIIMTVQADSTSSGIPEVSIELAQAG